MLTKLSIQNYALIDDISIDFTDGLTTITGETGAGKSILLGGIGLILGNRATTKTLRNLDKKCVIEGEFSIEKYNLEAFFITNDIDYYTQTIIRRELLPSGKSRAFVNDTPVKLDVLIELKKYLIDVHSQHQTLQLNDVNYQLQILDSLANTATDLKVYKKNLSVYKTAKIDLESYLEKSKEEAQQQDYHLFLFEELETANFAVGEQEKLETEIEKGNNVELIQQNLSTSYQMISAEEMGVLNMINNLKTNFDSIQDFDDSYKDVFKRIQSIHIDFDDIETEISNLLEKVTSNPKQLEKYNDRLQLLYNLQQKHNVNDVKSLLEIQENLSEKVRRVLDAGTLLTEKENMLTKKKKATTLLGKQISKKRKSVIQILQDEVVALVQELGMPNAKFQIDLSELENFTTTGINSIEFLFTANKGGELKPIKQVASGGELSRIMLAFKSIMAKYTQLPSIIFDEIDTGVSGEIAIKMAAIMKQMSQKMQVISITHLPQIAASGVQQMKVYKEVQAQTTATKIKLLTKEERITELAEMLGGKALTDTAIKHAKLLLKG